MRILILSFYYQPDLCAGSFRNTAVVEHLLKNLSADDHVDVITTLPNRYAQFSAQASQKESSENFTIHRIQLPLHHSGMVDQSKAFLSFARDTLAISKRHDYDLVFASSSRLMTATLGALIARQKKIPLYLDIRDIFVDTLSDVLPRGLALILAPIFSVIEKLTFSTASKINLVSEGFRPYFESRYPGKSLSFFTNGIDDEFMEDTGIAKKNTKDNSIKTVLYAGNIGAGQGMDKIIPQLAVRLGKRVHFKVIGDGGQIQKLKDAIGACGLENVELVPPMGRRQLIAEYLSSDVLFLHLNNHKAFEKVLPSKLFEYAAMNKPIWAGLAGYSARFVETEISNCALFSPSDIDQAVSSFDDLCFSVVPRREFINKFRRNNIMAKMALDILATVKHDD